jgi:hypothetical protein
MYTLEQLGKMPIEEISFLCRTNDQVLKLVCEEYEKFEKFEEAISIVADETIFEHSTIMVNSKIYFTKRTTFNF